MTFVQTIGSAVNSAKIGSKKSMNQSNKSPISPTTKAKGCAKKKVVKQSTINITMLEFHFLEETTYPFFKTGFSSKPTLAGARIKKGKIKIDEIGRAHV